MKLNRFNAFTVSIATALLASVASAQTTWVGSVGGGDDLDWENVDNWSNGAPSGSNAAIFNTATGQTALLNDFTVSSITFNAGVGNDEIVGVSGAGLTVTTLTNNTASTPNLKLVVSAGGNATWNGPFTFSSIVNLGTRQITVVDSLAFTGTFLNIDVNSLSTFGRFLGGGTTSFSGVTVNLGGTFTGAALGNSFDFTTGSFTGATLNLASLPSLADPVNTKWDVSGFQSTGVIAVTSLAVVPEPSTWAAIVGVASLGFAALRRRRTA